ncbi:hypothetical protein [Corynebacterium sp. 335C]
MIFRNHDNNRRDRTPAPADVQATEARLTDDQRHALAMAQCQVLPDDLHRARVHWWELGGLLHRAAA